MQRLAWSILALLPLGATADEIFRSVDENGVVVYSDRPSAGSEEFVIRTPRPASPPTPVASPVATPRPSSAARRPVIAEMAREPDPALVEATRARNCEIARQASDTYNQSRRLFRTGPDGEREYLSDAELTEARATAEANVAAWCD